MSNINDDILFNLSQQLGLIVYDNNLLYEYNYPSIELNFPSYWSQSRRVRSVQDVLEESMNVVPVFKNVISEEGKLLLKEEIYDPSNNKELESNLCPISLIEFTENENLIRLPCNHLFNKENIMNWLEKEKAECPVCRYQLPSNEVRNEENDSSSILTDNLNENTNNENNYEEDIDDDLEDFIDTYTQRQNLFNRLTVIDMLLNNRYQ